MHCPCCHATTVHEVLREVPEPLCAAAGRARQCKCCRPSRHTLLKNGNSSAISSSTGVLSGGWLRQDRAGAELDRLAGGIEMAYGRLAVVDCSKQSFICEQIWRVEKYPTVLAFQVKMNHLCGPTHCASARRFAAHRRSRRSWQCPDHARGTCRTGTSSSGTQAR